MNKILSVFCATALLGSHVQAMQNIGANGFLWQNEIIVCPGDNLTLKHPLDEKLLCCTTKPVLVFGNTNNTASFTAVNPVIISGNISNNSVTAPGVTLTRYGIPLLLSVESNANVSFEDTLTLRNVAMELKTDGGRRDPKLWHCPTFTVTKQLSLVGIIGLKAELINKITIQPGKHTSNSAIFDVSKLDNTLIKFEKNWDYITISGYSERELAEIKYYNPNDAEGITDILEIKNVDAIKKDLYIKNIQYRLEKLFVGNNALLKGLRFENIKIYNYKLDEYLFTDELKKNIKKLRLTVIDK